jgi:hypothetical protein
MSHCTFDHVIDCSGIDPSACSDSLLDALGHGDDLKLRADVENDVVHGSVTIIHNPPPIPHEVTVNLYDTDEEPGEGHQTTFRCSDNMPSTSELKQRARNGWEN